ncbi:MAG: MG2 domain-containing protein, partial [Acidobacteria bacterium]|nr:MG2 domain-containing protein [Acidobacteriota bacterium]MDW7984433.1 MG2 domain-containing protein [Acidobacteriota bacterium]
MLSKGSYQLLLGETALLWLMFAHSPWPPAHGATARISQAPSHALILPPPLDTQVFGQTRWLAGADVVLKVVTMDRRAGRPVQAEVRVVLKREVEASGRGAGTVGFERVVFQGRTDDRGIADARFPTPSQPGPYRLSIAVRSPIGDDLIEQNVAVEEAGQVLLTTDKPLYQPGQTVHVRALALLKPDGGAAADRSLTFEVRDPKGNLVFRSRERTSRFGVAAARFPIADEVTLGEYRITAKLEADGPSPGAKPTPLAVAERTVRVERYVLPKFKVTLETDRRFYLPAETLRGTVTAAYFFGKPVSRGRVAVRLSTFAAGWHDIAELEGTLDGSGRWSFETPLPPRWVGLPLEGGHALLRVEATVTDAADHTERVHTTLPISQEAIRIAVIPESPDLKPHLPMGLFIVTTYPDGTPAKCRFEVIGQGVDGTPALMARGETDALGIGETTVRLSEANRKRQGTNV